MLQNFSFLVWELSNLDWALLSVLFQWIGCALSVLRELPNDPHGDLVGLFRILVY